MRSMSGVKIKTRGGWRCERWSRERGTKSEKHAVAVAGWMGGGAGAGVVAGGVGGVDQASTVVAEFHDVHVGI